MTGDEAPLMSQLSAFLEAHPGWEPIESDSEDDDDEDEEDNGENENENENKAESKCLKFCVDKFTLHIILIYKNII